MAWPIINILLGALVLYLAFASGALPVGYAPPAFLTQ